MYRYRVERWLAHGKVFSVSTATLALLPPIETREVHGRARRGCARRSWR
jgi:hypothetical protein